MHNEFDADEFDNYDEFYSEIKSEFWFIVLFAAIISIGGFFF